MSETEPTDPVDDRPSEKAPAESAAKPEDADTTLTKTVEQQDSPADGGKDTAAKSETGTTEGLLKKAGEEDNSEQAKDAAAAEAIRSQQENATEDQPKKDGGEEGDSEQAKAANQQEDATENHPKADGEEEGDSEQAKAAAAAEVLRKQQEDAIPRIAENFYYDYDELVAKPSITEAAQSQGLKTNFLNVRFAMGYNCRKRSNLHVLDDDTLAFAAGSLVQLYNMKTKEQRFLKSLGGHGVGAIAVHHSRSYLAVGEKGKSPVVAVYEWPSLKLWRMLRHGTEAAFAHLCFSPDGDILAALGSEPDFMLTLYDWRQEQILLRAKAHGQDVFRVSFSQELAGQLTTSGSGHIKFWKMADTFTGLKLQGRLGRFGKTEISDMEGYIELPDGKVLSGCEWGNMLLWDDGLIKLEVTRKNKKPCHTAAVEQVLLVEGELLTIGLDGFIRVWDLETVDTADVSAENPYIEMEPMNELKAIVSGHPSSTDPPSALHGIVRSPDPTFWYAQDKNGAIWKLDLSFTHTSLAPQRVLSTHSGEVPAMAVSPISHLLATAGSDGTIRLQDFASGMSLGVTRFPTAATSIIWASSTIDKHCRLLVAGFSDGVIRILVAQPPSHTSSKPSGFAAELTLKSAFKPHSSNVTALAFDPSSKLLATGGADSTIFFFSTAGDFEPIGFITVPGCVNHMVFNLEEKNPSNLRLLVSCSNGIVAEVAPPTDLQGVDHSMTYKLKSDEAKVVRHLRVKSIKSRLRHEEELERIRIAMEKAYKKLCAERREMAARGLIPEGEPVEPPEPEMPPDEWEEYVPEEPCPILFAFYTNDSSRIIVSRGGYDAGYLYECQLPAGSLDTPVDPVVCMPVPDSDDMPITCFKFSSDMKRLYFGFEDGLLRIHTLTAPGEIAKEILSEHYSIRYHDCQTGCMTSVCLSFDEQFILTSAHDGTIFCAAIEEPPAPEPVALPPRVQAPGQPPTDITDPNAYSIEEAKQKLEHDRAVAAAEARKTSVRKEIDALRSEFAGVIGQNDKLPKELQLKRQFFEMEEEIRGQTHKANDDKLDLVQKEMAFDLAKAKLMLDRTRRYFYQELQFDLVKVRAFGSSHLVTTFALVQPSPHYDQVRAELENLRLQTEANRGASEVSSKVKEQMDQQLTEDQDDDKAAVSEKIVVRVGGALGDRIHRALERVAERRQRRAHRRHEWEQLYAAEPGADWQDPADVAAIEYAKLHIGDYKLKSSDDYVVPPHLRMNAYKASLRLLQIKEYIYKTKTAFNDSVTELLVIKKNIMGEINAAIENLQHVQLELPGEMRKPLPTVRQLSADEQPQNRFEITESEIQKASSNNAPAAVPKHVGVHKPYGHQGGQQQAQQVGEAAPEPSEYEKEYQKETQLLMEYEQDRLLRKIEKLEKSFDARLKVLEYKQNQLCVHIRTAELQEITLFEELMLLKDFEQREHDLEGKVEQKFSERADLTSKLAECQRRLDDKKRDIEKVQERESALTAEFKAGIADQTKWIDFLTRVFKKRIKRRKKKEGEEDDEEEEEEEEDDDSEESEEEAGGDDDEDAPVYDLDICPSGLDANVYTMATELRERRLDLEELLTEEKKAMDAIRKELETLQKRSKATDTGLTAAKKELEAFQQEKQRRLNSLDVVVILRLHQLMFTENGALPADLTQCLIFEEGSVLQLRERIQELRKEIIQQKQQKQEAKARCLDLELDRRRFERHVASTKQESDRELKAKFGKEVDLEVLETITVSQNVEELRERLREAEKGWSSEREDLERQIKNRKTRLIDSVNNNTTRLQTLTNLMKEGNKLVHHLDANAQRPAAPAAATADAEAERDRARLVDLVQLQAQELENLRMELASLSRKDGHVSPPSQPPPANSLRLKPNF